MLEKLWQVVVHSAATLFIPLVCNYLELNSDLYFNGAYQKSQGVEWVADQILIPCHYLFVGKSISNTEDGDWNFQPRFEYMNNFEIKSTASIIFAIPSFVLGSTLKSLCLLKEEVRQRVDSMERAYNGASLRPFSSLQLKAHQMNHQLDPFVSSKIARRPGDENHLKVEKEAFAEITRSLTDANLSWWTDCGTCLGVYRHEGVIPWDEDLDIAVFRSEFENVRRVLNRLDRKKYLVQDWSSREHPNSLLKVYIQESGTLIDVYFFDFDEKTGELAFVFALENSIFFPEWWKIRERRFKAPISFDRVFPLKTSFLDGIEVFVPKDIEFYLQRYYGENLAPAKIYDPQVDQYVKDLSHPYWQRAYVH